MVVRQQRDRWFKRMEVYGWVRGENYKPSYHSGVLANIAKNGTGSNTLVDGVIDAEQELI